MTMSPPMLQHNKGYREIAYDIRRQRRRHATHLVRVFHATFDLRLAPHWMTFLCIAEDRSAPVE
jgi:hypothetical protein